MMKLTDAIMHAEEIAEKCDLISEASKTIKTHISYRKCAEEHRQLAEWLKELQKLREGRPQGKWKAVKASIYPYGYDVKCSECGFIMGSSYGFKYCPHCGAEMKGKSDE